MVKTSCLFCGKKVKKKDIMYPTMHYECCKKFYKELEKLGVIDILGIEGTNIMYKFNDIFKIKLDETLEETRYYIITDETVDEDIITVQGVLRAVMDYLPKSTPQKTLFHGAELVFNSLMKIKYGPSVPLDKKFNSRVKEFMQEVYRMPISENMAFNLREFRKLKLGDKK